MPQPSPSLDFLVTCVLDDSTGGVFPERPLRRGRLLRLAIGWCTSSFDFFVTYVLDASTRGVFPQRTLRHGPLLRVVIGWLLDKTVALLNFLRTYGSTGGVTPERPPWHGRCCFQWFLDETVTYVIAHVVSTS